MQRLILFASRFAVRIFYRFENVGHKVPDAGPVILVANHPNGLVDPVLVTSLTRRRVRLLAKAPLFGMPVLGSLMRAMGALPVYRTQDGADTAQNASTFDAVFRALGAGDLVCLFPEGKSHDEPTLQQLKTGAARMALGAAAGAQGSLNVRIIPVGLVYRAKRRFRSRAAICVGRPIGVQDLLGVFDAEPRAAVHRLNARIAEGLGRVTLRLESWDELPLLELAASSLGAKQHSAPAELQAFSHRLWQLRSGEQSCAPELQHEIDRLGERVGHFLARVRSLGLAPGDLQAEYPVGRVLRFVSGQAWRLVVLLPPSALGALLWAPPYQLVSQGARLQGTERDQYATVQILAGMLLFPAWWLGLSLAFSIWQPVAQAWLVFPVLPLLGLMALRLRDWRKRTWPVVKTFLRLGNRRRLRELLVSERDQLGAEVRQLQAQL